MSNKLQQKVISTGKAESTSFISEKAKLYFNKIVYRLFTLAITLSTATAAVAQATSTSGENNPTDDNIITIFQKGGWVMWPILALGIVGVGGSIAKLIQLNKLKEKDLENLADDLSQARNLAEALNICKKNNTAAANIYKIFFEFKEESLDKLAFKLMKEEDKIDGAANKYMEYINSIDNLATMFGFYGTISGAITAFKFLAMNGDKVAKISGGIAEALITTGGGLLVAIPIVALQRVIAHKISDIKSQTNQATLDVLMGEIKKPKSGKE